MFRLDDLMGIAALAAAALLAIVALQPIETASAHARRGDAGAALTPTATCVVSEEARVGSM